MKIYLLPLFLLAACDQQQDRSAGERNNNTEMRRDDQDRAGNQNNLPTTNNPANSPNAGNNVGNNPNNVDANRPNNGATGSDNPPFLQSEKAEDVKLTADIRKAVLGADGLSMSADNVQIITRDGVVLLRGMVDTQAEKDAVEKIARQTPGTVRVDNQLTVRPPT